MDEGIEVIPAAGSALATPGERDHVLSERIVDALEAAVPANTARAYRDVWATWEAWCDGELRTPLPATPQTLTTYVYDLLTTPRPKRGGQIAPSTVEQHIAIVRSAHDRAGHEKPDATAALDLLKQYRKDLADQGQRVKKSPPITARILRLLVEHTDTGAVKGVRDRFLMVAGHNMMARRSELAGLNLDEVHEEEDDLVVYVRRTKTDQAAQGREVRMPRHQHAIVCPIRAYREWTDELDEQGITDGRLLRSIDRHGTIGPSLSGDAVNDAVRNAAYRAREVLPVRWSLYSAHGLRSGGATQARTYGAAMHDIAEHGGWNPRSPVVYGYVRAEDAKNHNVMRPPAE